MFNTPTRSSADTTATGTPAAAVDAITVAAQTPLRARLGLLSTWKADRATAAQTLGAVREIDSAAVAASTEITLTAIDHRRAELRAALAAAGVIRFGAIAKELLLRSGVVQAQLTDVQFEAFIRQVEQRARFVEDAKVLHAAGKLSDAEIDGVINNIVDLIAADSQRSEEAATRAKDMVGKLADTAASHIERGPERSR